MSRALALFRQDALRRRNWTYMAALWFLGVLPAAVYLFWDEDPLRGVGPALAAYYLVIGLHFFIRLKQNRFNILAPDILFIGLYTLFHLGYITLYALSLVPFTNEVFFYKASTPKALLVVSIGLLTFIYGYELSGPLKPGAKDAGITPPPALWCTVGTIVMAAGLTVHLGTLAMIGPSLFLSSGYDAVQNISRYVPYLWALLWAESMRLFLIGLVVHVGCSCLRQRTLFSGKAAGAMTVGALALVVLEGDRGPILQFGIVLLMARHYVIKPLNYRTLGLLAGALLAVFTILGMARTEVFNPVKMWDAYQVNLEKKDVGWESPIVEMGGSFLILSIVCGDVPDKVPYWHGRTWLASIVHTVPFLQRLLARQGWDLNSPSTWVTETYFGKNRAGRGFTVSAEGYLNFGLIGVIGELFFFGVVIRRLGVLFAARPSGRRAIIFLGCMVPSLMVVRNHTNIVFNSYVQVFAAAFLLGMLTLKTRSRFRPVQQPLEASTGGDSL